MPQPTPRLDRGLTATQCFTIGFGSIIGTGWLLVPTTWVVAKNTIHHSARYPLHVVLPIVVGRSQA